MPSACCKKYVGKSCSFASLGLFCTRWCRFLFFFSFFFHLLMAKSRWPAHGIAQICFCAVGGEENQECQEALGNRRSSASLLARAALTCEPTVLCACLGLLLLLLLIESYSPSCSEKHFVLSPFLTIKRVLVCSAPSPERPPSEGWCFPRTSGSPDGFEGSAFGQRTLPSCSPGPNPAEPCLVPGWWASSWSWHF